MRSVPCPSCLCCGSAGAPLYQDLHDRLFNAPGSWSLKECPAAGCGLLWLDPMPLAEDLSAAYRDYHTHDVPQHTTAYAIGKCLYRLPVDGFLSLVGIPAERRRANLMFIGELPPATLLDVGCGDGSLLATMARRGWRVKGVELDPLASQVARTVHGVDVHTGTIDAIVATGETFDVVTASHVVEHVPDPVEFLSQCRKVLRPGGRLVLRTPNARSWGHRRYASAWRGLEPPRHLHIFTAAALAACARKAGFEDPVCFTSSTGAEGTLTESHFLRTKGSFRPDRPSPAEQLVRRVIGPIFAFRAKLAWRADPDSGEELYAVLAGGNR